MPLRSAISDVAEHGTTQMRRMYANLMGAAGLWPELDPGDAVRLCQHAPVGPGRFAIVRDQHAPAFLGIDPANRRIDDASRLRRRALGQGPIDLADQPLAKQPAEALGAFWPTRQRQAARGVSIQPMGERRSVLRPETQGVQSCFQVLPAAWASVNWQTGRLVDHHRHGVAVKHPPREIGCGGLPFNPQRPVDARLAVGV